MKISWYFENEGGSVHLFDGVGELPLVDSIVYINSSSPNIEKDVGINVERSKFTVVAVYRVMNIYDAKISNIITSPKESRDTIYDQLIKHFEQLNASVIKTLINLDRVYYTEYHGEVVIKRAP